MAASALGPVVVGFDGSPSSLDALALGARVAEAAGEPLVAVFVYRADAIEMGDMGPYEEWQRSIAFRELAAAKTLHPSVEVVAVRARSVARGLHEAAESRGAGLVVVGGTHHGAIGRIVPGSTAQRLLDGAPCPVAVAPRSWGATDVPLPPVVAGFDGEPDSVAAVSWAAEAARLLEAPLRLVTVVEPLPLLPADPITFARSHVVEESLRAAQTSLRETLTREVEALASSLSVPAGVTTVVLDGHPADNLVAQAPETGGLIVVGSRGYGPIGAVLMGSVSAEVLRESRSPVVVVPRSA